MNLARTAKLFLLAGLLGSLASAQGHWGLVDCNGLPLSKEQEIFAAEFREATPGSDLFVPVKSPRTAEDLIRNLRWQVEEKYADGEPDASAAAGEVLFRRAWKTNGLTLEVVHVADWSDGRCVDERRVEFFYLVRARPADGSPDLARMLLDHRGLVLSYAFFQPGMLGPDGGAWPRDLEREEARLGRWATRMPRRKVRDGQYVVTESPAGCHEMVPCFAFRNRNTQFIESMYGRLYKLLPMAHAKQARRHELQAVLDALPPGEVPFSVGKRQWLPAVEVVHPEEEQE